MFSKLYDQVRLILQYTAHKMWYGVKPEAYRTPMPARARMGELNVLPPLPEENNTSYEVPGRWPGEALDFLKSESCAEEETRRAGCSKCRADSVLTPLQHKNKETGVLQTPPTRELSSEADTVMPDSRFWPSWHKLVKKRGLARFDYPPSDDDADESDSDEDSTSHTNGNMILSSATIGLSRRGEIYLQGRLQEALARNNELSDRVLALQQDKIVDESREMRIRQYLDSQQKAMQSYFDQQVRSTRKGIDEERKRFTVARNHSEAMIKSLQKETQNRIDRLEVDQQEHIKRLQASHKIQLDSIIEQIEQQASESEDEIALKDARIKELEAQIEKSQRTDQKGVSDSALTQRKKDTQNLLADLTGSKSPVHISDETDVASAATHPLQALQRQIEEFRAEKQSFQVEIARLNSELAQVTAQSQEQIDGKKVPPEVTSTCYKARGKANTIEKQAQHLDGDLLQTQQLDEKIKHDTQKVICQTQQYAAELQERLRILETAKDKDHNLLQDTVQASNAKDVTIIQLQKEIQQLQQALVTISLEEKISPATQSEIEKILCDNGRLKSECQEAREYIRQLQMIRNDLQCQVENLEARSNQLIQTLQKRDEEIIELKQVIGDGEMFKQRSQGLSKIVDEVQQENKKLTAEARLWRGKYHDDLMHYQNIQKENAILHARLSETTRQRPQEKEGMPEATDRERRIRELEKMVQEERIKRAKSEDQAHKYFKQITERDQQILKLTPTESTKRQIRNLEHRATKTKTELEAQKKQGEEVRLRMTEEKLQNDIHQSENIKLKTNLDNLTKEKKMAEDILTAERQYWKGLNAQMGNIGISDSKPGSTQMSRNDDRIESSDQGVNQAEMISTSTRGYQKRRRSDHLDEGDYDDEDNNDDHDKGNSRKPTKRQQIR